MGSIREPDAPDVIETGSEPEFVASTISRFDTLPNGWIRLYIASQRGIGVSRIEYSVICAPADLARMGRQAMDIAAQAHNILTLMRIGNGH